jgi:hypothetical protein
MNEMRYIVIVREAAPIFGVGLSYSLSKCRVRSQFISSPKSNGDILFVGVEKAGYV